MAVSDPTYMEVDRKEEEEEGTRSNLRKTKLMPALYTNNYAYMLVNCTIDCIDYITGIGNAHAHNGVHSVLRLG